MVRAVIEPNVVNDESDVGHQELCEEEELHDEEGKETVEERGAGFLEEGFGDVVVVVVVVVVVGGVVDGVGGGRIGRRRNRTALEGGG